jgi:hypothetical protein
VVPPSLTCCGLIVGGFFSAGELTMFEGRPNLTSRRPCSGFPAKSYVLNFLDHLLDRPVLGL